MSPEELWAIYSSKLKTYVMKHHNLIMDYFRRANKYTLIEDINEISVTDAHERARKKLKAVLLSCCEVKLDNSGNIIDFCNKENAGAEFSCNQEVKRLNRALQPQGIEVEWLETKLDDTQIPQSNNILFNGVPIKDILDIKVSENYCDSCTDLLGTDTYCRTVIYEGNEYEDIPAKAIRRAAFKVLGIEEVKKAPAGNSGCCNNSGCC